MAAKNIYVITTADDTEVGTRTEGKAADKFAEKLTGETGLVHRVYTPTGKLRLETEVIEPAPVDDVPAVDINDVIAEVIEEAEVREAAIVEVPQDGEEEGEEETVSAPAAEEAEEGARQAHGFVSYATLLDLLKSEDDAVRNNAATEWAARLEIYKKRTNAKDPAQRIVGPAMAAALERGETTDGRTVASLAKRGLVVRGEGVTFTVNAAGKAALAAAVEAVAPTV